MRLARRLLVLAQPTLSSHLREGLSGLDSAIEIEPLPRCRSASADPYGLAQLAKHTAAEFSAILLVVPRGHSPADLVPAPALNGTPVGLIFASADDQLTPWLRAVGEFPHRADRELAVLAMWKPFYLEWGARFAAALRDGFGADSTRVRSWFADEVTREELCERLAHGQNLVLYVGHGRERGWSGYRGLRWRHIDGVPLTRPIGAVVSLTCSNLKAPRAGDRAFGLNWVGSGRACAFFGAADSVRLRPLASIASDMIKEISSGAHRDLAGFIAALDRRIRAAATPPVLATWNRFRLIGNPVQRF